MFNANLSSSNTLGPALLYSVLLQFNVFSFFLRLSSLLGTAKAVLQTGVSNTSYSILPLSTSAQTSELPARIHTLSSMGPLLSLLYLPRHGACHTQQVLSL